MWEFKGDPVTQASCGDKVYSVNDFVDAGTYAVLIAGFRVGRVNSMHQARVLLIEKSNGKLQYTHRMKWIKLNDLGTKIENCKINEAVNAAGDVLVIRNPIRDIPEFAEYLKTVFSSRRKQSADGNDIIEKVGSYYVESGPRSKYEDFSADSKLTKKPRTLRQITQIRKISSKSDLVFVDVEELKSRDSEESDVSQESQESQESEESEESEESLELEESEESEVSVVSEVSEVSERSQKSEEPVELVELERSEEPEEPEELEEPEEDKKIPIPQPVEPIKPVEQDTAQEESGPEPLPETTVESVLASTKSELEPELEPEQDLELRSEEPVFVAPEEIEVKQDMESTPSIIAPVQPIMYTNSLSDSDVDDDPLPARLKKRAAKIERVSNLTLESTMDSVNDIDSELDLVAEKLINTSLASPKRKASPKKKRASPNKKSSPRKRVAKRLEPGVPQTLFDADMTNADEDIDATITPRNTGIQKFLPNMPNSSNLSGVNDSNSRLNKLLAELHPASEPEMHPCREDQFDQLFYALETAIQAETGTCIYVSGTPGTGKTSTIKEVLSQLDLRVRDGELRPFKYVEINGMKLVHPNAAYEYLWQALDRGSISQTSAMTALEKAFSADESRERRGTVVVLLDEMDQLITKGQQLMYNFFNWPSLQHSRLIVIAVANTMDLPERVLSNKISSRVGLTRIQFPGYTHDQLKEIIRQRLEFAGIGSQSQVSGDNDQDKANNPVITDEAIDYATRKVASVGGDARRVLEFVKNAIYIAQQEQQEQKENLEKTDSAGSDSLSSTNLKVRIVHIKDAIMQTQRSPLTQFLETISLATKVFLCALLSRTRRMNTLEVPAHDVLRQASQFVRSAAESDKYLDSLYKTSRISSPARLGMFQHAIVELIDAGIIMSQAIKGEATVNLRLMTPANILKDALQNDRTVKGMI